MAEWKRKNCNWSNAGKWDHCAKCGAPRNLTYDDVLNIQKRQEAVANFLVTTTHNLEGMVIVEYLGVVSAVVVLGTGIFSELNAGLADIAGSRATGFQKKLEIAREAAIRELKQKAFQLNGTAIVGLDLEYMTIGGNMLMVSANGTAVRTITKGA